MFVLKLFSIQKNVMLTICVINIKKENFIIKKKKHIVEIILSIG